MKWEAFDRFDGVYEKYLPSMGEGETKATQIVTAVCKLVYKWYNDGDVYDNVRSTMSGWCNNLSSYANWLWQNTEPIVKDMLESIFDIYSDEQYEQILFDLADKLFREEYLAEMDKLPVVGTIYKADGPFEFREFEGDEEY